MKLVLTIIFLSMLCAGQEPVKELIEVKEIPVYRVILIDAAKSNLRATLDELAVAQKYVVEIQQLVERAQKTLESITAQGKKEIGVVESEGQCDYSTLGMSNGKRSIRATVSGKYVLVHSVVEDCPITFTAPREISGSSGSITLK